MAGKGYTTLKDLGIPPKLHFQPKKHKEALTTAILIMQSLEEKAREEGQKEWAREVAATEAALVEIRRMGRVIA